MFLIAVIIMLFLIFKYNNLILILVNGILTLYVTVSLCAYYLFETDKKYFKNIPILVITAAVIENILLVYDFMGILYITGIIFYILLTVPIFIKKKNTSEESSLERKMKIVAKITITLVIVFLVSLIPFSLSIYEISYVSSLYWAVYTVSYQIPGLVYCISRFSKKDSALAADSDDLFGKKDASNELATTKFPELSSLTKRENEVALAICKGDKYEDIAKTLFITLSAVKKHAYSIYKKLGIKNNRELLHIFMEAQKSNAADEPVS